ncbi:dynein axonemal assembly factor 9-like [Antedon mediterranea]|uniref:dynein axonemal assembly factor 9-like n=1 Tax=Antedon mediterranea TaxID=105859 RepID=UPI003AF7A596
MSPKRPSSARRYVTQECFSSFVSSSRLHNVQNLLRRPNDSENQQHPDAVLSIMGIDSRYNDGCKDLINYLLFGFFDVRKTEIESSGYDEETIDDLVILVKKDSVHVYCNPINYHYLLPYIGSWQNLQIHCMTEEEYEDDEAAEIFKIKSFIEMNQNCQKIGIPYTTYGHYQQFDPFTIEKWPLVQAHGLDEFGAGGFFTMRYEVIDISPQMTSIYSLVDPVSLEGIVTEKLPLFERQCHSIITYIDMIFQEDTTLSDVQEKQVFEPIQSYFNHGRVSSYQMDASPRQPYLMFGSQSTKENLKVAEQGLKKDLNMTVNTAGPSGKAAKHMVFQAVCPRSFICCARTYFFNSGYSPYPIGGASPKAPSPPKSDIELLNQLYQLAIDTVLYIIDIYGCQTASIKECKQLCLQKIKEIAFESKLDHFSFLSDNNHVELSIIALDKFGNKVDLEKNCRISYIKTARLCIYDIPSLEHAGQVLGSVVFSESFVTSSVQFLHADKEVYNSECLVLTKTIPRVVSWAANKRKEELIKQRDSFIMQSLDVYGKLLVDGETVQVLGSANNDTPSVGELYVYEKAIILNHCRHGVVVFPKSYVEAIQLYDGESFNKVAILVMIYRHSLQSYLPLQYHTPADNVMFILQPKTRVYKIFYSEVVSLWQTARGGEPQLKQLDQPPESYADTYRYLDMMNNNTTRVKSGKSLVVAKTKLPQLNSFLDHLSASTTNQDIIPSNHLPAILNAKEPSIKLQTEVVVTIVCGIPGSHKENLCKALTNMAKEQSRWVTLKAPFESRNVFDAKELQASLSATVAAAKKRSIRASSGGRKRLRILYIPPGFVDLPKAVYAIQNHPDAAIASQLSIGAVTTCIDPINMYIANRLTMPKLLNQCAEGWVNNVLFTSCTEPKDPNLARAQQLIRAVNSDVAFIIAHHGEVTRSPDAELILSETAFQDASAIRARHHNPDRCIIPSSLTIPVMDEIVLTFRKPLEKAKFVNKLHSLKANLNHYPFTGNIYAVRAKVTFTDLDKQIEVQHVTLSGYLSMIPINDSPIIHPPTACSPPNMRSNGDSEDVKDPNCAVFTGCGLSEQLLKDWLRSCAKQKPVKKVLRAKSNLTKQELKNIHTKHHLDALPEGWFYNGCQYVSMAGEKNSVHPNMGSFIENYIVKANESIEVFNNMIDKEHFYDLFA